MQELYWSTWLQYYQPQNLCFIATLSSGIGEASLQFAAIDTRHDFYRTTSVFLPLLSSASLFHSVPLCPPLHLIAILLGCSPAKASLYRSLLFMKIISGSILKSVFKSGTSMECDVRCCEKKQQDK